MKTFVVKVWHLPSDFARKQHIGDYRVNATSAIDAVSIQIARLRDEE